MRPILLVAGYSFCLLTALQLLSPPSPARKQKLSIAVGGLASSPCSHGHTGLGVVLHHAGGRARDAIKEKSTRTFTAAAGSASAMPIDV